MECLADLSFLELSLGDASQDLKELESLEGRRRVVLVLLKLYVRDDENSVDRSQGDIIVNDITITAEVTVLDPVDAREA